VPAKTAAWHRVRDLNARSRVRPHLWRSKTTPDGHLLTVDGDTVSICAPIAGACTTQTIDAGSGGLKIGGNSYES
jgi:hypothetical protein